MTKEVSENKSLISDQIVMTSKMHHILEFLREEYNKTDHIPTLREVSDQFGFRSSSTAKFHIDKLVAKGFLIKSPGGKAYLPGKLFLDDNHQTNTPFDSDFYSKDDTNELSQYTICNNYSLSLGVYPNDVIIYRKQDIANQGDYCLIRVNGETMIRQFTIQQAHVWFIDNSESRIDGVDVEILGIVLQSRRNWRQ